MSEDGVFWYGYKHTDGSVHTKRYFSHGDIEEARESDFVAHVVGPFEADNRESAVKTMRYLLKGETKDEEAVGKDRVS